MIPRHHHDARIVSVRTTVVLDDDVAAAVERMRRERGIGLSEALNELARLGLAAKPPRKRFRQRSEPLGLKLDVTCVARAIEELEGPASR